MWGGAENQERIEKKKFSEKAKELICKVCWILGWIWGRLCTECLNIYGTHVTANNY